MNTLVSSFARCALGLGLILASFGLQGCSSPGATPEANAAAKRFTTNSKYANLYLYRDNRIIGAAVSWDVSVDGKELGRLPIRSFMMLPVTPGGHVVSRLGSITEPITVQAGRNYFVRVGSGSLSPVSDEEGREIVAKLKRVEVETEE